jgi:hypothetical protein
MSLRAALPPLAMAALVVASLGRPDPVFRTRPAPPFPSSDPAHWIGSPQTWSALRGRVVLLEVWTFG